MRLAEGVESLVQLSGLLARMCRVASDAAPATPATTATTAAPGDKQEVAHTTARRGQMDPDGEHADTVCTSAANVDDLLMDVQDVQ